MDSKKKSGIMKTGKNNSKIQHRLRKNINRNDKKNVNKTKQIRSASTRREKNINDIKMGGLQSNDLDDEVARNSAYRRNNMPMPNAATGHNTGSEIP